MPDSLLTTKLFFPPARRGYVPRRRLVERLVAGLRGPLTLVSAPAGYGKTTLLSEWRAGPGHEYPAAWLSLDANDSDPVLFLRYLVAALGSLQASLVDQTALLLQSPQLSPYPAILTSLVNELSAFAGEFALILDDYHEISTPEIHDALSFLLTHAPPQMHLVFLTREDPPLPLSRLRARGQLVEIREADLRFSPQEAAAFLAQTMGLALPEETVADLGARTEGWAAGLQMAGLSLQLGSAVQGPDTAIEGRDRYVMDYLMDEVFHQQPDPIQRFLLRTSVLEQLSAPLCDALLAGKEGQAVDSMPPLPLSSSQEILEYLERANLFLVPLDNRRAWYRYHRLFADLLQYRLQRESPDAMPELHHRAARWYAQEGRPDEAMRHAFAAPDLDLAAELAERFAIHMIGGSRLGAYLSWVRQLPEALILQRAYICAGCGWATVLTHRLEEAVRYVEAGQAALSEYEPVSDALGGRMISRAEVRGHLAAIQSYADREMGELDAAIEHAQQALDLLSREALAIRAAVALNLGFLYDDQGQIERAHRAFTEALEAASESRENVYVAISALGALGSIAMLRGKLNEAEELFSRATQCGTGESGELLPIPAARLIHGWVALLHYQRNELDTAQQHLDAVMPAAEQMGDPRVVLLVYLYQALLDLSRGALASAERWLEKAEQMLHDHRSLDDIRTQWLVFRGRFYLKQGDLDALLHLLSETGIAEADLDAQTGSVFGERLGAYLLLARALHAQGRSVHAMDLLERICALAERQPNVPVLLEALAMRAGIAAQRDTHAGRALSTLERALALAAPEGFVRPFLHAGPLLVRPLRQAIAQGTHAAFAHRLLAAISEPERPAAGPETGPSAIHPLFEPLTERETQVLRLLAAGLTSTEAAEELILAVSTVRSYIKSLYGKLDAHSRDEAVDKGHQYGLL